jgi:chromosome segregation protein
MLRRIDLRGFKSFAGHSSLEFGPGVNVIVGPNGSGKSNLAEAIVWALGEQRATRLRAGGMTDVVFSGGEGRQPAGFAEVRLLFGDDDAAPSGSPAEVEVSRRVTRAGEATYRLRGEACRLLDVHEALAGRGLGPDALAVIRQGQVEAVCTSRPSELRAIVEEAAGIGVSKRRRRRAEQKLARVADRLDRARDLATELTSRRASLERQAGAARRAAAVEGEIDAARTRLTAAAAHDAARRLARFRAVHEARVAEVATTREAFAAARTEHERIAAAAQQLSAESQERNGHALALRGAGERLSARADLAQERITQADRRLARADELRRQALDQQQALTDAHEAAQAAHEVARTDLGIVEAHAESVGTQASEATARHATAFDAASAAAVALAEVTRRLAEGDVRVARLTDAEQEARWEAAELAPLELDMSRAERRLEISTARVARTGERVRDARRAADDASALLAAADDRHRAAAAEVARLAPRSAKQAQTAVFGDGLEVEAGLERAMGASLGALADARLVSDLTDARRVLDDGAPAAVLSAGSAPTGSAAPNGCRPMFDVVTVCPDAVRTALQRVLTGVWLVDDLAAVPAGVSGLFVTRDGDAVRPTSGVVFRPTGDWARAAMHRVATHEAAGAEAAMRVAERAHRDREAAVVAVARRARAAERSGSAAQKAVEDARAAAAAQMHRAAAVHARVEEIARERAEAERTTQAASTQREHLVADEARLRHEAQEADGQARGRRDEHRAAASEAARARAEAAAAAIVAAEADARLHSAAAIASAPPAPIDLPAAREAARALSATAKVLQDVARDQGARVVALVAESRDAAQAVEQARVERERCDEHQCVADAAAHAAELDVAGAAARAAEIGPPPEGPAEDFVDVDPEQLRIQIEDLERRRRNIGAVNPLADEEREEIDARIADLTLQIADLEEASAALSGHMEGLDDAVTAGFDEVFAAVRTGFSETIAQLFPGGEGRLVPVETDDDDEPGLVVEVVPAGKRPRPLALLSGGERSLVALSFCLAIAMARPAPFYLLDEVEAALDDANLRRFLAVVARLAGDTQFIVITHQQPTVEIADTLFGVTMGGDGTSQVVARRLQRADEMAEPVARPALMALPGGRA